VENVSARRDGDVLYLPAGPYFRLEKEIKNVVTSLAKTCHYWTDHMPTSQRSLGLADAPLLEPPTPAEIAAEPERYRAVVDALERGIRRATALATVAADAPGWLGVRCASEEMA